MLLMSTNSIIHVKRETCEDIITTSEGLGIKNDEFCIIWKSEIACKEGVTVWRWQ